MTDRSPLIIKRSESGWIATMPRARPDTVFVLSYADGGLKTFRHAPGMSERAGSRWCHVVDVSQRFSSGELTIPARGDAFFFQAWFDAGWQVGDAEAVVRNNIEYGEPVVSGFLSDAMWRRGRRYDPDDVAGAEEEITRAIHPPVQIGSGLVLTALNVRLALDSRQATAASEDFDEDRAGRRQADRMRRLRSLVDGDESFLLMHLAEHQGDTGAVLNMLMQARERNDKTRMELLDRMLKEGFIQDADIAGLRDSVLGGGGMPALPSGNSAGLPLPSGSPSGSPPYGSPPPGAPQSGSAPASPYPAAAPAPPGAPRPRRAAGPARHGGGPGPARPAGRSRRAHRRRRGLA